MNISDRCTVIALIALLPMLAGCLEHRYTVTALPDRSVEVVYELRGDRADIEDGHELLPDSAAWGLQRTVEESEEKTTHLISGRARCDNPEKFGPLLLWGKSPGDTIYFQPRAALTAGSVPFGTIWRFRAVLPSRCFIERYGDIWEFVPEECRALEEDDAVRGLPAGEVTLLEMKFGLGVIQWNRDRYERAFDQVWRRIRYADGLLRDSSETTLAIARAGWVADLHSFLNNLDVGEPQTANLDWWGDLRPLFLSRFVEMVGPGQIEVTGGIADAIQAEYAISKDLEDDNFHFEITFPGYVLKTNGDRDQRRVIWEVNGKTMENEESVLTAFAFQVDFIQVGAAPAIVLIIIWSLARRRRSRRDEAAP